MAAALCALPSCNRTRHRDASTGIVHDFCGRTHAEEYARRNGQTLQPPHGICHVCKLPGCAEQVYYDESNGRVHDFCCKSHADQAIADALHPPSQRPNQQGGRLSAAEQCALPGCTAPKFQEPDTGELRDYCGRTHARLASERGLQPPPAALGEPAHFGVTWKGRGAHFNCANNCNGAVCGLCEQDYELATLTNAHPKYEQIKRQFTASWDMRSAGPTPTVQRVLQVRNPAHVFERFEAYKEALARAGRPVAEERRFHATSMRCAFGIDQGQRPCEDASCAVCSIAQTSFKLEHAGGGALFANLGFLRYGRGLYFSKTSSKSHSYGGQSQRERHGEVLRCMFLCKVALGRALRTAEDRLEDDRVDDLLRARGRGGEYDSVVGLTTAEGGKLNYEESVVYSEEAALPSYLVVYKM
jgi:hypothetical protein